MQDRLAPLMRSNPAHKFKTENPEPGYIPVDTKVLFLPDIPKEMSAGGVIFTEIQQEQMHLGELRGVLISSGGNAFKDFDGMKPQNGQRIIVSKFAGVVIDGLDGRKYRLIQDRDVCAVESSLVTAQPSQIHAITA